MPGGAARGFLEAPPEHLATMPDKDDKTKGRTALPGQYAHDESGEITEKKTGKPNAHSANDRRAASTQGDSHRDDAGDVPADHG